jgi:hypothetical protein
MGFVDHDVPTQLVAPVDGIMKVPSAFINSFFNADCFS